VFSSAVVLPEVAVEYQKLQKKEGAMPHANNQGIRIHYQIEGVGTPLLLQHGCSDSVESWYEQGYVAALRSTHQLILIDARGHGASDKPHDPAAYAIQHNVADILAVLDTLQVPAVHFFGYSMGGQIGFAMAKYAAARCVSMILGGADPYQSNIPERDTWLAMLQQGMASFIEGAWVPQGPISAALRARLLANDVEAMIANRIKTMERPSFAEVVPTMTMPCLLYAGEADGRYAGLKACRAHMPNATFVSVPGLNHAECFFRSDLVLPHITKFLATVSA
jgi:pimeloyl-ACP methyl ester carboxylesterase